MFERDQWREVFYTLGRNKLRTGLTAFGVSWGIFMLIVMLAAGTGLQNGTKERFGGFASNSVYIWTQRTTMPYKGLPRNRWYNFNNSDIDLIKNQVEEIDALAPRNQLGGFRGGNNVTRGIKTGAFSVMGDYPEIIQIQLNKITAGRFLNENDLKERRKVCVIGTRVKEVLFNHEEDPIGEYIRVNGVYFMVIGVFTTQKSGDDAERDTQTIFIPFTTFQQAFNFGSMVGWFAVKIKDQYSSEDAELKIKRVLAKAHSIHPDDSRAIGSYNSQKDFENMNSTFVGISWLTWIVGSLTLLAGIIGISNIMLVIIKERTLEIGIRRAIGARPTKIISQIMMESVFLTFVSGYLGLVAGVFIVEVAGKFIEHEFFKHPEIDFSIAVLALTILIVAGLLAGILPALKAINIKPVEALRANG